MTHSYDIKSVIYNMFKVKVNTQKDIYTKFNKHNYGSFTHEDK